MLLIQSMGLDEFDTSALDLGSRNKQGQIVEKQNVWVDINAFIWK